MKLFHFNTRSKKATSENQRDFRIKGKKYAEFYYYIMQGAKITYGYTILIVMLLLASVAGSVDGLCFWELFWQYFWCCMWIFPEGQAGCQTTGNPYGSSTGIIKAYPFDQFRNGCQGCLEKNGHNRNSPAIYRDAADQSGIENGVMEIEAYRNFAERCGVKEVKKFSTLIIQNLEKR